MTSTSDRRTFLRALLAGAAGLTVAARVNGQSGPPRISVTTLTDRVVALSGNGGNVGLILGPDGLALIDGGLENRAGDLAATIAEISPRLVQVLFNTHYHFDHTGINARLGSAGVAIVAHENVRTRLATTFENPAMGRTMEALPAVALPTETFATGGRLTLGQETIEYTHAPMAHTDGDAFVFLPASNAIHTGDLYWVGRYPVVDYTVGGSLARMGEVLGQMAAVGDAQTRIIPGHGPLSDKAELGRIRDIWLTINDRLEQHARQGHPVDEVIAAAPTRDFDTVVGVQNPVGFLRQAYGGVLARRNTP
jgi:cyclase